MNTVFTPKLTKQQKQELKDMRKDLRDEGGDVFAFRDLRVAIAIVPSDKGAGANSEFVRFSMATCADDDVYRGKTGKFLALERMAYGECVTVRRAWACDNQAMAEKLAEALTDM